MRAWEGTIGEHPGRLPSRERDLLTPSGGLVRLARIPTSIKAADGGRSSAERRSVPASRSRSEARQALEIFTRLGADPRTRPLRASAARAGGRRPHRPQGVRPAEPREEEVLRLLALGLSSDQIAARPSTTARDLGCAGDAHGRRQPPGRRRGHDRRAGGLPPAPGAAGDRRAGWLEFWTSCRSEPNPFV